MEAFVEKFQHLKIQLEDIQSATGNFHNNNVIGKGGFGKVYKGVVSLSKGRNMVAIKRLDRSYGQGEPEFWKEILMLSRYTHENLISLLGFCDEDGEKILVYELASHGSLDRHLTSTTLRWRQRLKICIGAATGLYYLHDPKETQQRVLHRDIKSSNILLDENWNAKVSDMGLSKVGPANQQHTILVSNVVGTLGYIDPMYMETSILTKESDIYSFGVVLFEVLCGRLCFEYKNGHFQSLVRMWKTSYKHKKLDEIIFQDLKQHMDLRSLETFSDIAYQCLKKSRAERPKMSHVLEKLEIALWFQENYEEGEPPMDYEEMGNTAVPPLVYGSKEVLKMLLSKGILVNAGETWFSLNKNGQHCEMISAAECLIPVLQREVRYAYYSQISRFNESNYRKTYLCEFKIDLRTQFLSPHVTYTVNLVFHLSHIIKDYSGLSYILSGETKSCTSYLAHEREDGWLVAELYHFTSDKRNVDLEITFQSDDPLYIEGIEFLPLERVDPEVLEDDDVDMQTISHSDTYWEQKLPSDYEDIIKLSKDGEQWTTKKELYSVLCKGFPINNGEEWFSLVKNGKKCHMLSASVALQMSEWNWGSSHESRFEEVAFDPHGGFWIDCSSDRLSPQTTYGCYLVYKLQENHSGVEAPLKVNISSFTVGPMRSLYIYLLNPQTPVIRPKFYQNTHNPLSRTSMKGLPQQRNDGWMEVRLWEIGTRSTTASFWGNLQSTLSDNMSLKGLTVQGIEFKPI